MKHGWTLKLEDWQKLIEFAHGSNWTKTYLDTLYRDNIPISPGVYAIGVKIQGLNQNLFDSLYNVIYVGREERSLRRRFMEHCNPRNLEIKRAMECFGNRLDYWFTTIINPNIIRGLEACLIKCLGPSANRREEAIPAKLGTPRNA